jgi:hypothetical protein
VEERVRRRQTTSTGKKQCEEFSWFLRSLTRGSSKVGQRRQQNESRWLPTSPVSWLGRMELAASTHQSTTE